MKVDVQPEEFVAEAIVRALQKNGSVENDRFLIVRAETTRDVLAPELNKLGAIVDEAIAYRTVPETEEIGGAIAQFRSEGADLVTFTSSSTVENFLALKLPLPGTIKLASIGPITSATLREHGLPVDIEARRHDVPGLIEAVREFYRQAGGKKFRS